MPFRTPIILLAALAAANVPAQHTVVVPPARDVESRAPQSTSGHVMRPRVFQQILHRDLFGTGRILISELSVQVVPHCSKCQVGWEVRLGYAATTPATASTTLASNRAGQPRSVFAGNLAVVTEPNQKTARVNVPFAKPFEFDGSRGDLLVEILETRAPLSATVNIEVSHIKPMSRTTRRGVGGPFAQFGSSFAMWNVDLRATSAGMSVYMDVYVDQLRARNKQTYFMVGLPGSEPISLAGIGAARNTLYVNPLAILQSTARHHRCGSFHDTLAVPVSKPAALTGLTASFQAMTINTAANVLGLVFSDVLDVEFGNTAADHGRLIVGDRALPRGRFASTGFATMTMTLATEPVSGK